MKGAFFSPSIYKDSGGGRWGWTDGQSTEATESGLSGHPNSLKVTVSLSPHRKQIGTLLMREGLVPI